MLAWRRWWRAHVASTMLGVLFAALDRFSQCSSSVVRNRTLLTSRIPRPRPTSDKMASEATPLIRTIVVRPAGRRQSNGVCRRFFSIAVSCSIILGLGWLIFHVLFVWPHYYHHGHHGRHSVSVEGGRKGPSHEDLEALLLETPSTERAEEWLRYYTAGPHLAGQNLSQVNHVFSLKYNAIRSPIIGRMDEGQVGGMGRQVVHCCIRHVH
jgi:hypothetical protein